MKTADQIELYERLTTLAFYNFVITTRTRPDCNEFKVRLTINGKLRDCTLREAYLKILEWNISPTVYGDILKLTPSVADSEELQAIVNEVNALVRLIHFLKSKRPSKETATSKALLGKINKAFWSLYNRAVKVAKEIRAAESKYMFDKAEGKPVDIRPTLLEKRAALASERAAVLRQIAEYQAAEPGLCRVLQFAANSANDTIALTDEMRAAVENASQGNNYKRPRTT